MTRFAKQYAAPPAYTVGAAIAPLSPTVTGSVTSCSVNPAIPPGLSINGITDIV